MVVTLVARIMSQALPHEAIISKEAKEAMQECAAEFISFITSEGLMKKQRTKHVSDIAASRRNRGLPTEEEDSRQRYARSDGCAWFRKLCKSSKAIPQQILRSSHGSEVKGQ